MKCEVRVCDVLHCIVLYFITMCCTVQSSIISYVPSPPLSYSTLI